MLFGTSYWGWVLSAGRAVLVLSILSLGFVAGFLTGAYSHSVGLPPSSGSEGFSRASLKTLTDGEYFTELKSLLARANSSVYVVMYVIKYDPNQPGDPVNQLLKALTELKKRGVDVRVVVDDETYKSYPQTINYLKNNGVPVRLDESLATTTHAKLIIIDNETVIIGSHNWTESALTRNHETSIMIQDKETATKLTNYFMRIWNNGRTI